MLAADPDTAVGGRGIDEQNIHTARWPYGGCKRCHGRAGIGKLGHPQRRQSSCAQIGAFIQRDIRTNGHRNTLTEVGETSVSTEGDSGYFRSTAIPAHIGLTRRWWLCRARNACTCTELTTNGSDPIPNLRGPTHHPSQMTVQALPTSTAARSILATPTDDGTRSRSCCYGCPDRPGSAPKPPTPAPPKRQILPMAPCRHPRTRKSIAPRACTRSDGRCPENRLRNARPSPAKAPPFPARPHRQGRPPSDRCAELTLQRRSVSPAKNGYGTTKAAPANTV